MDSGKLLLVVGSAIGVTIFVVIGTFAGILAFSIVGPIMAGAFIMASLYLAWQLLSTLQIGPALKRLATRCSAVISSARETWRKSRQ